MVVIMVTLLPRLCLLVGFISFVLTSAPANKTPRQEEKITRKMTILEKSQSAKVVIPNYARHPKNPEMATAPNEIAETTTTLTESRKIKRNAPAVADVYKKSTNNSNGKGNGQENKKEKGEISEGKAKDKDKVKGKDKSTTIIPRATTDTIVTTQIKRTTNDPTILNVNTITREDTAASSLFKTTTTTMTTTSEAATATAVNTPRRTSSTTTSTATATPTTAATTAIPTATATQTEKRTTQTKPIPTATTTSTTNSVLPSPSSSAWTSAATLIERTPILPSTTTSLPRTVKNSSASKGAAAAGGAVAGVLAIALIAFIVVFVWLRNRSKKHQDRLRKAQAFDNTTYIDQFDSEGNRAHSSPNNNNSSVHEKSEDKKLNPHLENSIPPEPAVYLSLRCPEGHSPNCESPSQGQESPQAPTANVGPDDDDDMEIMDNDIYGSESLEQQDVEADANSVSSQVKGSRDDTQMGSLSDEDDTILVDNDLYGDDPQVQDDIQEGSGAYSSIRRPEDCSGISEPLDDVRRDVNDDDDDDDDDMIIEDNSLYGT